MGLHRWVLAIGFAAVALAGYASWQRWGPLPDNVAASVDGSVIPVNTLNVFVAAAQRSEPQVSRETVLKGLVENRLLAALAHDHDDLAAHGHADTSRVGYDAQTRHEQQRFKLIRTAFADDLRVAVEESGMADSLDYLTEPLVLSEDALAPLLSLEQALYATMTEAQQQAASQLAIARYRFAEDQPEQTLTLWDLYRRQNIQLKVQMHNLNTGFIREAIKQQLTMEFVFYWFDQHSGLSARAIAAVDDCIDDAMSRDELLHDLGLMHDIHDDNPQLRALAAEVSQDQIAAYYQQHQDEFTRVERVHAYHLRVNSQAEADRIYAELLTIQQDDKANPGEAFADAVARYSVAGDREQGGALGWVDRDSREDHWTRALAFVQPVQRVSPPFRSPATDSAPYWELLWVDQKEMGYQRVDSESVRYRAAQAIAREQMQQRFQTLLADATEAAALRVNHEVL
ncbi:peptidylprolyl isomerase [Alcanivorax sp.]|uniref:peptidylprolyl isomerase n=1 Tax=Alcanivorax sp. TaxID=1872427 RepID=UPI003A93F28C